MGQIAPEITETLSGKGSSQSYFGRKQLKETVGTASVEGPERCRNVYKGWYRVEVV